MKHLMVDIETLSTHPNAAVIAIGAVYFDLMTGETGAEFYCTISRASCERFGLHIDPNTLAWWKKQSGAAQAVLNDPDAIELDVALQQLSWFIQNHGGVAQTQVWGNGAPFDNVIIASAFRATGFPLPWKFWNDRDVRTIVEFCGLLGINPKQTTTFDGVRHNALDDAKFQIKYTTQIIQRLLRIS